LIINFLQTLQGPSETEQTLYSILAIAGEVLSNRGGWRDVGF